MRPRTLLLVLLALLAGYAMPPLWWTHAALLKAVAIVVALVLVGILVAVLASCWIAAKVDDALEER